MLIGLMGYGGSGKSTVAAWLREQHGFVTPHIKRPVVVMLSALLRDLGYGEGEIDRVLDGDLKREVVPELGITSTLAQQTLGKEWMRDCVRPDFLTDLWCRRIDATLAAGGHAALESTRFVDEAGAITARGGVLVEVRRPGAGPTNGHASEGIPARPNVVIQNDGSIADLHATVDRLIAEIASGALFA